MNLVEGVGKVCLAFFHFVAAITYPQVHLLGQALAFEYQRKFKVFIAKSLQRVILQLKAKRCLGRKALVVVNQAGSTFLDESLPYKRKQQQQ
ncbi:MAG: hypothetical protein HC828_17445 [Blastochloris sp.]|nr:hypothetical protein [Blastochloris sp.]